jgi:hypothetical protein
MPHLDTLSLRPTFRGQSLFARPVAALTTFVQRFLEKSFHSPTAPRIVQDLEVRRLEEAFRHAHDVHELERMERDYDRRDAGGVRAWEWR